MSRHTTNGIIDGITNITHRIIDSFTDCFIDSNTDSNDDWFINFLENNKYYAYELPPELAPEHIDCVIRKGSEFSDGKQWLMAAYSGDIDKLKLLIDNGVDKNHADRYGKNALFFAVFKDHIHVIQYLLELSITLCTKAPEHNEGPDMVFQRSYYMELRPCMRAIHMDNLPVVKMLEQYGCQTVKSFTALRCAVLGNSTIVVKYLLSRYEYPLNQKYTCIVTDSTNDIDSYPRPILTESGASCVEISKLLMDHGADPYQSLVAVMVSFGKLELIALFIRRGVDVDYLPFPGNKLLPFQYDVKYNSIQVAAMLLHSGCSCGFFSSNTNHLSQIYNSNPQLQDLMIQWKVLDNIVKPLRQQCRKFIVNHLYPAADKKITKLPLPATIINYLGYPELDAIIDEGTKDDL